MNQYKEARERTKAKIENAYWDLMMNNERITVLFAEQCRLSVIKQRAVTMP